VAYRKVRQVDLKSHKSDRRKEGKEGLGEVVQGSSDRYDAT
jgi:hypothetical protein